MLLTHRINLLIHDHRLSNDTTSRTLYPALAGEVAVAVVNSHLTETLIVPIRPIHDHWGLYVVWFRYQIVVFNFHLRFYNCPLIQLTGVMRCLF